MALKTNLNYYIAGMLLLAVIISVGGRSGLVENLLPFGDYRANTQNGTNVGQNGVDRNGVDRNEMSWNKRIPLEGGYKQVNYNGSDCKEAKELTSADYVYVHVDVGGVTHYLNFDNEVAPNGAVYFSKEGPNDKPTKAFEMIGSSMDTIITLDKYKAQKWKFEMVDQGLDNCDMYISTTYSTDDPVPDIPYYLTVLDNGNLGCTMFRGRMGSRWRVMIDSCKNVLMNPSSGYKIDVGSAYLRDNTFSAVNTKNGGVHFRFKVVVGNGGKFTDWTQKSVSQLVRYKPSYDDPQGAGAGTGFYDGRFSKIWNGVYSGKDPITVSISDTENRGVIKYGKHSYDVKYEGSNMLVSRNSNGVITFTAEMLSGDNELPKVRFIQYGSDGKLVNLSSKTAPDNMAAYSLFIANKDDYLASNGYGPIDSSKGLGYSY